MHLGVVRPTNENMHVRIAQLSGVDKRETGELQEMGMGCQIEDRR